MQKRFKDFLLGPLDFIKGKKLLVAISGGVDSVALAHLCHKNQLDFSLAHCNFNLRGDESDADEEFVIELGDELKVEVFVQNFDIETYTKLHNCSVQMAARELRYDWLHELAEQLSYDYILTAHHADDNLETFLINFTRGTGLNGLKGIPVVNGNVVRPFLSFSREDILTFVKKDGNKWREDSSNQSRKYLRNKLRHDVIPILKEINPHLLESFQETLSHLNDTADIVEESLNAVAKRAIVSIDEGGITYKVSEFKKVNNSHAYLYEMFKDFGFTQWDDVLGLLDAETGKYVTSDTHKLQKHREFLILSDIVDTELEEEKYEFNLESGEVSTTLGLFQFEFVTKVEDNTEQIIYVDRDKLNNTVEVRKWESGDIFYPLGMVGKKKLSKFLKDEKCTPYKKANTYVLLSNGQIVWVIGSRADERYKVTENTVSILKIVLT